jgi:hypothetical protein
MLAVVISSSASIRQSISLLIGSRILAFMRIATSRPSISTMVGPNSPPPDLPLVAELARKIYCRETANRQSTEDAVDSRRLI